MMRKGMAMLRGGERPARRCNRACAAVRPISAPSTLTVVIAGTPAEFWVKLNPVYYPELAQRHVAGIKRID